jgi:flagellar biosynthetic protein FliR
VIPLVAGGVLVFARIGGLLMTMPGFSARAIPAVARLGLAVPLTLLLLPTAAGTAVPTTVSHLLAGVVSEAMLGIAMGTAAALAFGTLAAAADLLSGQIGMHIAAMLDPLTLAQPGAVGVLATWLGTGVFLGAGMHLRCLLALGDSLRALPPGAVAAPLAAGSVLLPQAGEAIAAGVTLAGPLTLFVFTVNLGLSILGRMAPNLQLFFAIGPSVTVVAGLGLLGVALPTLLSAWCSLQPTAFAAMGAIAEAMR